MEKTISVRIPKEGLREIEHISRSQRATKSVVLREVLEIGIKNKMLSLALEKFQKNELTAWKAARFAGVPLTEFLDILKEKGLEFHYTALELSEEFEGLI